MRNKIKTFLCGMILLILLPLVVTLLFQGEAVFPDLEAKESATEELMTEEDTWDDEQIEGKVVAIVAKEISVNSQREAIKAQAIIARTNLIGALLLGEPEPDGLSTAQMLKQFGEDGFERCYEKLESCVEETKGLVMTSGNKLIEASYFSVSAGRTRSAADAFNGEEVTYLKSVESLQDIDSEEYLRVEFRDISGFVQECNGAFENAGLTEENPVSQIEILSRDEGEYVKEIRVGAATVTGEDFRKALGLHSACFTIKEVEGKVRIVTKGFGHGVGLSQYGAKALAEQGKSCEEILKTYFTDIKITEYKKVE